MTLPWETAEAVACDLGATRAFDDLPPRPGKLSSHVDADIGGVPAPAPGKRLDGSPREERSGTNG